MREFVEIQSYVQRQKVQLKFEGLIVEAIRNVYNLGKTSNITHPSQIFLHPCSNNSIQSLYDGQFTSQLS